MTTTSSTLYQSLAEYRYAQMQRFNVRPVAPVDPANEPITLETAYKHLHISPWGSPAESPHDDWLTLIGIPGARAWCEAYLEQTLAQVTLELTTDRFPDGDYIDLPFGPVREIESIIYLDQAAYQAAYDAAYEAEFLISGDPELADAAGIAAGNLAIEVTLDPTTYALDSYSKPHRVYLAYDEPWPSTVRQVRNAVRVRYLAGHDFPGESPTGWPITGRVNIALLLMLGHLWRNREETTTLNLAQLPLGVKSFLDWDSRRVEFA